MKKILVPALVIAVVGGYFYYQNLQPNNPEPVMAEAVIAEKIKAAAEEMSNQRAAAPEDVIATAEGDVFADVPEAMADEDMAETDPVKE